MHREVFSSIYSFNNLLSYSEKQLLHLQINSEELEYFIDILYYKDAQKRLIALLLILCKLFGIYTSFGILLNLEISHKELSRIIGSTRVTVTRILNDLKKEKIISINYKFLVIHDPLLLIEFLI
uniref:global nitrogen transcriptional regulator n=1 Tax=Porphyridium aerugineum TaxID=2792 RepID=UPI001FCCF37F|nr:global nitrogen transcriptional regulator [Porphyridium aerugineum]UNJ17900.1 global nitrogen transcriptional regulator [Porphyridium aerugineum]